MFHFVRANPNEFLVIGKQGSIVNLGLAASAFLWPGTSWVLISSAQQETPFEMTQETRDGIPLRFKGIVIYRVIDPEVAARRFSFGGDSALGRLASALAGPDGKNHRAPTGHEQIKALLNHVCLGELRAAVSHMTMADCFEQRETTLTAAVTAALKRAVMGQAPGERWGIALDVVQVAQVFIVDQELRRQLEAEVRDAIKVRSELSDIRKREEIKLAEIASERRMQQEHLQAEKERMGISRDKLLLQRAFEQEKVEAETPLRLLKMERETEVLHKELEKNRLDLQVRELKVKAEMMLERAKQELRKELLPLEQVPALAEALSGMLSGLHLTVYGQETPLLSSIGGIVEQLAGMLRLPVPGAAEGVHRDGVGAAGGHA